MNTQNNGLKKGKELMQGMILLTVLFFSCCATAGNDKVWLTDFEQAKKLSAERKLPILADFTGSKWCPYCIKLDKEVFSKTEFIEYAKKNFILLKIDFPKQIPDKTMETQKKLAEKYEIKTFPSVVILDKNGDFIMKSGYREGGCKPYIAFLKIVKKLAEIYAKN